MQEVVRKFIHLSDKEKRGMYILMTVQRVIMCKMYN